MTQMPRKATTVGPNVSPKTMKMTTYHPRTPASRLMPPSGGSFTPIQKTQSRSRPQKKDSKAS